MSEFVGKYYRMDPETELVIPSGYELKNGMRVLIEDPRGRESYDDDQEVNYSDARGHSTLLNNRWCVVDQVITKWPNGDITFLGIYDDGIVMQRVAPAPFAWIVKKDSIQPAELKYRSSVIVSQYTVRFNQDGTTSIYITETEDGAVTEFVIGDFTQRDAVSHLVNENLPPVNPKAPLFKPSQKWIDPGAKADDGSDYKSAPNLENLQRHDPEWALRNLGQNYRSPSAKSFGWADDLKQQTCLEVMVDPMDASRTHSCILKLIPAHDVHEDGFGMYWRKNGQDQNEIVIKEPKTHEKIQIVDIHRCGFTWINRDTTGTVTERVHSCAKPSHDAGEPHVDASGVECEE